MKKILIAVVLVWATVSHGGDLDLSDDVGIAGAITKQTKATEAQTAAIISVGDEIKKTSSIIPEVMKEIRQGATERGQHEAYILENRSRIKSLEGVATSQQTLMSKFQVVLDRVVKNEDEQKDWIKGTFFVVLAAALSCVGGGLLFVIGLIIKLLTKRPSAQENNRHQPGA